MSNEKNVTDPHQILSEVIRVYEERSKNIVGKNKITTQEIMDKYANENGVARLTLKDMVLIQKANADKPFVGVTFKEMPDHVCFAGTAFKRVYDSFIEILQTEHAMSEYFTTINVYSYMKWIDGYKGARQLSVELKGM